MLNFRYSVVDREGESDVHEQEIDFHGPTDIGLNYLGRIDVDS
jgi:hypothetical protein